MDGYSLGQTLREAREGKELRLEDAEATLKIRHYILEGFEQGNFNVIDASPVQIRGFIRNYARYLALDEDRILSLYDAVLEGSQRQNRRRSQRLQERNGRDHHDARDKRSTGTQPILAANQRPVTDPLRQPLQERSNQTRSGKRSRGSGRVLGLLRTLLILIIAVAAVAVIAFVTMELLQRPTAAATTSDNGTSQLGVFDQLPPTLTPTPRPSVTPIRTPTFAAQSVQNYAGEPVFVTIELRQRTWLRVNVDSVEQFVGVLRPQEAVLEYRALTEIIINASNAAALVITYNGQLQPGFGARGQGVDITFRPNNDITIMTGPEFEPTPIFSPTPQDTAIPLAATLLAEETASSTPTPTTESLPATLDPLMTPLPALETPILQATETPTLEVVPPTEVTPEAPTPEPTTESTTEPTIAPTETSSGAILPPRITPTNVTPTKEGA